ncbi:MAG: hypothetical protein J6U13_09215 [Salinivirgaceae bacterium]|nr:hypothetical protein [Salinivirgaceae bacterium]
MNQRLIEQLEAEASRANTDLVVAWTMADSRRLADLAEAALNGDVPVGPRAMWALSIVAERDSQSLQPFLPEMVKTLPQMSHTGMRRLVCKILMLCKLPTEFDGPIIDFCFRMLEQPDEPIGVKGNCMSLIAQRLHLYPELKPELKAIVDDILTTTESRGLATRAKKLGLMRA